jgi:hypothetical protein
MKRKDVPEILTGIVRGPPENAEVNQVPNHFAEIIRLSDAPVFKHRRNHRAKRLDGDLAQPFTQLLPCDMAALSQLPLPQLYRVIEAVPEKKVSIGMISWVGVSEHLHCFGEIEFVYVRS